MARTEKRQSNDRAVLESTRNVVSLDTYRALRLAAMLADASREARTGQALEQAFAAFEGKVAS